MIANGASCAETETATQYDLTFNQLIDMLEPQIERTCRPVPGFEICSGLDPDAAHPAVTLPKRSGAIIRPSSEDIKIKKALEDACRDLGSSCTPEIKQVIANINAAHTNVLRKK